MLLTRFDFYYRSCFYFILIIVCNAEIDCNYYSRRVAVTFGAAVTINLDSLRLDSLLIKNLGQNDIDWSISSVMDNVILHKGIANNTFLVNVTFDDVYFNNEGLLRLENFKNDTSIVYVTVWYRKFVWGTPSIDYNPMYTTKKNIFYRYMKDICETSTTSKMELTWYEKYTNNLGVRDYSIMFVNMIPFLGPVIDPILETFWKMGSQSHENGGLFPYILHDLNNYYEKKSYGIFIEKLSLDLEETKQKLNSLNKVMIEIVNMTKQNFNDLNQIKLKSKQKLAVDQYINLVFYINGREVLFMPKNIKRRHYFLEIISAYVNFQSRIFSVGLIQENLTSIMKELLKKQNFELPLLESQNNTVFLDNIKIYSASTIENYNNYVQNLIDNIYTCAYEDSLEDQNIYSAVSRTYNHILEYGVKPLHMLVEKFLIKFDIPVKFKIADFPRPYLCFSNLFGVPTLESAIRASSLIDDLYSYSTHEIYRSTSRMDVRFNVNNDIIGIVNYDGEIPSVINSKLLNFDSTRHNSTKNFSLRIPLHLYIDKTEICLERVNDWLTKVISVKIHIVNNTWIDLTNTKQSLNASCFTFAKENHSIYQIFMFSDICSGSGAAVNAAVVFKHLDGSNNLMNVLK